nr:tRNA (adenosine(37)-N6)-threonylcarbamoyltransferase complex transferase subunit TsaD [Anaerolineae bacterium]
MVSILGIETSCDETAAAVVVNGRRIASSVVASQVDLHAQYGGVFPEVASRAHVEAIGAVVAQALIEAGMTADMLDAIAVTRGPGLVGSLLVGISYAKGLALMTGKPLLG